MALHVRPRALIRTLLARRMLLAVLVLSLLAFAVFSALVGFPQMLVLVAPVAVGAWAILEWATRRGQDLSTRAIGGAVTVSVVAVFGLIQLEPYGRDRTNPPVTAEPRWSSPQVRELMVRACFGCHSNEVEYPSYASVAPISWMVQSHVDEGREKVNYSEWDQNQRNGDETIEVIKDGSMPPGYYTRFGRHPEARLTDEEISTLLTGLAATPGMSEGEGHGGDKDGGGDDD